VPTIVGLTLAATLGAPLAWAAGPEVAIGLAALAALTGVSITAAWWRAYVRRHAPRYVTLHPGYLAVPVNDDAPWHLPVGPGAGARVGVDEAARLAWVALPRFAETTVLVGDLARTPVPLAWPAAPVPNGPRVELDAADLATLARAIEAD
jgi:hypothetical protein